jgi:hypothetical protein
MLPALVKSIKHEIVHRLHFALFRLLFLLPLFLLRHLLRTRPSLLDLQVRPRDYVVELLVILVHHVALHIWTAILIVVLAHDTLAAVVFVAEATVLAGLVAVAGPAVHFAMRAGYDTGETGLLVVTWGVF